MSVRSTKMIFAWMRELRRPDVEAAREVGDLADAAAGVGDDQRVGRGVGDDAAAALGQDRLSTVLAERGGLGVVDPDDAGLQRLERVERGEHLRRVDADDAARHFLRGEALGGEHGLEGLRPRLVLDLGGHFAGDRPCPG